MTRVYIAGPMTGLPEFNYPAFRSAELTLNIDPETLWEVVSPAIHADTSRPREYYIRSAINALLTCEAIYMLQGWEQSRGALMEWHIAANLGLRIMYQLP